MPVHVEQNQKPTHGVKMVWWPIHRWREEESNVSSLQPAVLLLSFQSRASGGQKVEGGHSETVCDNSWLEVTRGAAVAYYWKLQPS